MRKIVLTLFLIPMIILSLVGCKEDKLEKILVTDDILEAEPGDTVTLDCQLIPDNIPDVEVTWEIVAGESLVTIDGNSLTIKEEAAVNSEIRVKAKAQDLESDIVTIKVVRYLKQISASVSAELVAAGESVDLTAVFDPVDATDVNLTWSIIEGEEYALIDAAKSELVVRTSAPAGAVIKVQATSGTIQSEVLTITVYDPKAEEFYLILPYNEITIDKNDVTKTLEVRVYDGHLTQIPDKEVEFTVIEGDQFLDLDSEGQYCRLLPKGHGTAVVQAKIKGTDISDTTAINVIVPPIALSLPEVFAERMNYRYTTGIDYELPFAVEPIKDSGTNNVCQDIVFEFTKKGSSAPSSEIGAYQDGKIQFFTTGEITVKAKSNSGSKVEAETSYTFNVNEGVNVSTFEELQAAMASGTGVRVINIVVLEKILPNNPNYGYDLVPSFIVDYLLNGTEQVFDDVQEKTVFYGDGSYEIIGNFHRINLQDQRVLTAAEYEDYRIRKGIEMINIDDLFQFRPIHDQPDFKVHMRDLEIMGNCGVYYQGPIIGENPKPIGMHRYAIFINKGMAEPYNTMRIPVDLKIENVKITNFPAGLVVRDAYLGLVKGLEVENLFGTGVRVEGSTVTFQDIYLGMCGAAGIELSANRCSSAPSSLGEGAQFNKTQEVRFIGEFNCTNYCDGNSVYLQNYQRTLLHATVADVIIGNLQVNLDAKHNVLNENGQLLFAALLFNELTDEGVIVNQTQIGGDWHEEVMVEFINMAPNDTTHKYVLVPLVVPYMGQNYMMGYAICYNLNYAG